MTTELFREPTRTTQDQQLAAPSIAAAFNPNRFPFAQIMFLRDKRQFWMRVGGPVGGGAFTGVAVWELIGGPGAALGWPKYVVNVAGQEPVTPYQSIQAAIDGAVADGHDFANPTQVLVFPGTYTETVSAVIGIHIVGFEGCQPRDTVIAGQLIIAPGAAVVDGSLRIANMDVRPTAKPGVVISGAGRAAVLLSNCSIVGDGAEAVTVSNTNAGSETILRGCICTKVGAALAAGTGLIRATLAVVGPLIIADGCEITVNPTTEKAVQSGAGSGTRINGTRIIGRIFIEAIGAEVEDCDLFADEQAVIDLSSSSLKLVDCTILHTTINAGPTIGGVLSTAQYGNVTWLRDRRTAPGVATSAVKQRGPIRKLVIFLPVTASTEVEDVVIADTGVAPGITYILPPLGNVFEGETTRIAVRSGVGGLTILPAAGDTLDLGGPVVVFPIPAGTYTEYMADPSAIPPNWIRIL